MSNRIESLGKLRAYFGFGLGTLVDRIVLQKTVYILAHLGCPGLSEYKKDFTMYIHGPYSRKLAKDAYEFNVETIKHADLSPVEEEKINLFKKIVNFAKDTGVSLEYFMACEMVADLIYFYSGRLVSDENNAFELLKERKTYFNDSVKVKNVIDFLRSEKVI